MGEENPDGPPASERRHRTARAARDQAANSAREQAESAREKKKLPQEHDDDRSPADPHDWQDEWDRARWAP
ncbi:hypothetical protein [Nocardia concava]|uniref:hypothetical protein n=1 Tax=Nocardia concava TaxID=257281 RepID=UPI000595210C|nr:hypothetical protein [Nocardia concava]